MRTIAALLLAAVPLLVGCASGGNPTQTAALGDGTVVLFDKPPQPIHMTEPEYPVAAKQAEIEGEVLLRMVIDREGHVAKTTVERSDASVLEGPAQAAASEWLFEPAEVGGKPVAATILIPVRFEMTEK